MYSKKSEFVIGSRGSNLALFQANHVKNKILKKTGIKTSIKVIKTKGDIDLNTPLPKVGDKGFFTYEIEQQLINNQIDFAVHSLKDLPVKLDDNFKIGAVCKRSSPFDILIKNNQIDIKNKNKKIVIATGSLRRGIQLQTLNENIQLTDVRGNIETRINKLKKKNWDGLIMAKAALDRLKLDLDYYEFSVNEMVPSANQGTIAIEVCKNRTDLNETLALINDNQTYEISLIESLIIEKLNGGCKTPIGCFVKKTNDQIDISIFLSNLSGTKKIVEHLSFRNGKRSDIINNVMTILNEKGAESIILENNRFIK